MNIILYYGGFVLAAILFTAAVFLFFYLKVPAAVRYFTHYKSGSMLKHTKRAQATLTLKTGTPQTTGIRSRMLAGNEATTIIGPQEEPGTLVGAMLPLSGNIPEATDLLATELLRTEVLSADSGRVIQGITEVLDRTEVLPEI